jgi:putative transposase
MQMLRQRFGRRYNTSARTDEQVWETRYSDVHVFAADHIAERLNFMHQAPVKAGLAEAATDWEWSSARRYAGMPEGVVTIEPVEQAALPEQG